MIHIDEATGLPYALIDGTRVEGKKSPDGNGWHFPAPDGNLRMNGVYEVSVVEKPWPDCAEYDKAVSGKSV